MAGLRFEKDGEKGVSLDEVIVGTAMKDPGVAAVAVFAGKAVGEQDGRRPVNLCRI